MPSTATTQTPQRTYSIKEASEITGLASSTLRYYEQVGVGPVIERDESSGHRVYSEEDVEQLGWIACLAATGMGIAEMREYVANGASAVRNAAQQVELLRAHDEVLKQQQRLLRQRRKYLALKMRFWQAVEAGDEALADDLAAQSLAVARTIR